MTTFSKDQAEYLAFDVACQELLGLDGSFLLEIAREALSDSFEFEWICERMDISDETMSTVLEDIQGLTEGILLGEDDECPANDGESCTHSCNGCEKGAGG